MEISSFSFSAKIKRPLKFAVISDLHGCDNSPVIEVIKNEKAQAVLVAGDFIHSNRNYLRGLEFLRLCAEIVPTFCVLGNHEKRYRGDLKALIEKTGAVCLDNDFGHFGDVVIGGLSSIGGRRKREEPILEMLTRFSNESKFKILLCHHPEYYERYIKERNIDLTLSGHAHGGQWRFFGQGLYSPGQGLFPKYTSGLYDGRLLVSRGLGNPYFIPRINNRPQLIVVDIK